MANPFQAELLKAIQLLKSLPMCQAPTCGRVRAPGLTPSSRSRMFILNVKTLSGACQREIATPTKFEREKHIERSNIKARVSVHWRFHCHAKLLRGSREFPKFSTLLESNPCRPTHCDSPQPLIHRFVLIYQKKGRWHDSYIPKCTFSLHQFRGLGLGVRY